MQNFFSFLNNTANVIIIITALSWLNHRTQSFIFRNRNRNIDRITEELNELKYTITNFINKKRK